MQSPDTKPQSTNVPEEGHGILDKVTEAHGQKRPLESADEVESQADSDKRGKLDPTRCHFYLTKKRRYCRTIPKTGVQYCVEHSHLVGNTSGPYRKRVPCPLDPKHSCYEDHLQKHLNKCNAREGVRPVYFTKDINGGIVEPDDKDCKVTVASAETEEVLQMVTRVRKLYTERVPPISEEMLFHEALREEAEKPSNGPAAQKHLQQNASLVAHLEKLGLLADNHCYIEFGAGKGGLSHWVQRALPESKDVQFLLVEKGSVRYKMDSYHKGSDQGPSFERLRIDIQHLDLSKVESLNSKKRPIVGLGKHLCGGATDLMLRCLVNNNHTNRNEGISDTAGLVLALCCHHRCDWTSYVGKDYVHDLGLSARDTHLIASMTSWATCATLTFIKKLKERELADGITSDVSSEDKSKAGTQDKNSSQASLESGKVAGSQRDGQTELSDPMAESDEHQQASEEEYNHPRYGSLTPEAREEVGYMCKRLLDYGRVKYLQQHGYDARLVGYTTSGFSLENIALLATKKK